MIAPALGERLRAVSPPPVESVGPWLKPPDIFAPLSEVNAISAELDICVGAPTLIAGYGYSMKTLSLQAFALAVAAGTDAWGRFRVQPGRAAHVDGEQGRRLTSERYQRLARGMGVDPATLEDRLQLVVMPSVRLDHPKALDLYSTALDGFTIALFDSLRALAPSLDENSSEVRSTLDTLGAVSEKTGCACLVIHHARKPQQHQTGGAKMAIRGSGAIFDACSSVLVFGGEKGKPVQVQHEKARTSGVPHDDFALVAEDVASPDGTDPRWAMRVVAKDLDELAPEREDHAAKVDANKDRIRRYLRDNPGVSGKRALQARVGIGSGPFNAAFDELEAGGEIRDLPQRGKPRLYIAVREAER